MSENPVKKQSFLQGAAILTLGTILVKLMGFLFKTPLQMIITEAGFGYFNTDAEADAAIDAVKEIAAC